MSTFAAHQDSHSRLAELDERARSVWGTYRENLVDLDGVAYDAAESAEWEHLQTDLRAIAAERAQVKALAEVPHAEER